LRWKNQSRSSIQPHLLITIIAEIPSLIKMEDRARRAVLERREGRRGAVELDDAALEFLSAVLLAPRPTGVCERNPPFVPAFALQPSRRNSSSPPDLVFLKLTFLRAFCSGGVLSSQTPESPPGAPRGDAQKWVGCAILADCLAVELALEVIWMHPNLKEAA
jgi:hypothetical protein